MPVLIAALGPRMLRIAGERSAGTITWATGPKTLEAHTVPILRAAASEAGRPEPRVVAGFPIALAADRERARAFAAELFSMYRDIPSYRAR